MKTKPLHELPWLKKFTLTEGGEVHTKSALIKNDLIGCYNSKSQLVFLQRDTEVYIITQSL